ncbi:MAG: DUF547 domain-containing protein [Hyphomicrobiaceae bacterium]|nr:DUF547 domain-containing protein [Hyphomicrobiaceae bacterium]
MTLRMALKGVALALALLAGTSATTRAQDLRTQDLHAPYDVLLGKYVSPSPDGINRVAYAKWLAAKPDRTALDSYVSTLINQKPSALTKPDAFAYWVNLYNALTLQVILNAYPVKSIRDIKSENWLDPKAWLGPWRTERVTVEGKRYSLDDIEHKVLRPTYKDPRVHYAVNCASTGCPNLMNRAWRAATLETDLDTATSTFINHPRAIAVDADGSLRISSIYKWFVEDFGGNDAGVIAHVKKYATAPLATKLANMTKIGEDQYDWSINESGAIAKAN